MKFRTSDGRCRCCGGGTTHHRAGCDWSAWAWACERARKAGQRPPGLAKFRAALAKAGAQS